jgi:hypothetical protein
VNFPADEARPKAGNVKTQWQLADRDQKIFPKEKRLAGIGRKWRIKAASEK